MRWFALVASFSMFATAAMADECPVTSKDPDGGEFGSGGLSAVGWPGDGKIVFRPGGPGFVDRDGALGIKFAWMRRAKGRLHVSGRRLDGEAAPLRAYLYDYGDEGFQPTYLVFPTPGCWQVTGKVADATLTFVVLVEKRGDGPTWKFEGIGRGWRVTR